MTGLPTISLTVIHDDPAGLSLSFLAADGRGHASLSRLSLPAAEPTAAPARQAEPGDVLARWLQPPSAGTWGWRAQGQQLAQRLLPADVRAFLGRHPGAVLMLQLPPSLLGLPWEWALDAAWADQPLDDWLLVQRHLLGAPPPAEPRAAAGAAAAGARQPRAPGPLLPLDAMGCAALAAGQWAVPPLPVGGQVLVALADSTPAALLAPAAGRAGRGLWWLPQGPAGSSADADTDTAADADADTDAAAKPGPTPATITSAAQQAFEQALQQGQSFVQAARSVRAQARQAGGPAASAWFYGDGRQVPWPVRAAADPAPPDAPDARVGSDDVRQLTVLSCDLVDSTRMMGRLGDEAYSEQLARYHARVAQIVGAHGGVSDDPQGDDGFMCYFGFPVASEDSAAQALRAGLALSGALADLQWQLRIGISTGRAVIRNRQPVGAVVHHAARLQSLAAPGTVLVSHITQQLTAERFVFSALADVPPLKGFDDAGPVHQVLAPRQAQGTERFDARPQLSAFVGRDAELQQLQQLWATTCGSGQRQALLLAGEAGIGKSRLVREFRRALAAQGQVALECRCAPEHTGSPLQPLIDLLQRQLGWFDEPGDAATPSAPATGVGAAGGAGATGEQALLQHRLRRIARHLPADVADEGSVALVASLLGLPAAVLPAMPALSPERQRQRTMALLLRWLIAKAERAPVCLIVEDVHWLDPSTREFIHRVIAGQAPAPLLLLLTLRGQPADAQAAGLTVPALPLAGLPTAAAHALLRGASGGLALDDEQLHWLASRADGVPLFIEESARMAVALAQRAPSGAATGQLREAVPATLQDLLMARLDQLPTAKRAAQLGGAIGRAFEHGLSQAVNAHADSPIRLADLGHELALLQQAGLVTAQGQGEQRLYVFKHALVRDAAHQSLLERDRKRLHAAIASVMQSQYRSLGEQQPGLLAQHLALAGQDAQALAAWERAARHAAQRSAHDEAIAHLRRALALADRLPEGAERDRTELRLQLLLASRLIATEGYGADRVEAVYNRALVLGQALGDAASLAKARLGLEGWHFMRGNFERAHQIARDVVHNLGPTPEPLARIQSTWALANIIFHQGQVQQAVALMDECLASYHQLGHRSGAVQDPGVMCLCYSSWALWQLGQADQSLQRARQVVDLAEGLNHPFSIGEAHGFLAVSHYFRGEVAAGLAAARRAIAVCEAGGFAVWLAHAKVMHGRLLAETDLDAGLEEMRQGDAMWTATGAVVTRPFYAVMRAEGLALAGRLDEALQLLDEAHALVQRHGERYYECELQRWIGVLTAQLPHRGGAAAAEPWLRRALAGAQGSGLHGLGLRAATSLGHWLADRGQQAQAVAVLQAALRPLNEGNGTRDLRAAQAALAQWR